MLDGDALLERIAMGVAAGISMVQVREKDLDGRCLAQRTLRILDAVRRAHPAPGGVPVVVNTRLDVALATGADGVHLPAAGLPPARVRRLVPQGFLVGVSAHGVDDLDAAEREGADYAFLGPAFATDSHPGRAGLGRQRLRQMLQGRSLPIWAVGGVRPETVSRLAGLPLEGVAAIRALLRAPEIRRTVQALGGTPTSRS